jgi:hypothetical protein
LDYFMRSAECGLYPLYVCKQGGYRAMEIFDLLEDYGSVPIVM